uniref:GST N-terminal domain-containing protein n=1 Tax=Phaeocystis antarctica TaxID=33657 RepID=A0A7S0HXD0_9EUKA
MVLPKVSAPPNFVQPTPRPLTVTRPSEELPSLLTGGLVLAIRLATGVFTLGWTPKLLTGDEAAAVGTATGTYGFKFGPLAFRDTSPLLAGAPRPEQPLVLYEYEGSPFCRKVREAALLLDVPVEFRPCPGARAGFATELKERTGRMTVPYLVDPNSGTEMFESDDIVNYMLDTYGPPRDAYNDLVLWPLRGAFMTTTATFATLFRGLAGSKRQANARPDNEEMLPLELWGYEPSPFVRPVREKLCGLCLRHVLIPTARGSANRDALIAKTGVQFQVPYLVDPNTGVALFESLEIIEYLDAVYTVAD